MAEVYKTQYVILRPYTQRDYTSRDYCHMKRELVIEYWRNGESFTTLREAGKKRFLSPGEIEAILEMTKSGRYRLEKVLCHG